MNFVYLYLAPFKYKTGLKPIQIRLTILMTYRREHFTKIGLPYGRKSANIIKLKIFPNIVILLKLKPISQKVKNNSLVDKKCK